ncbi:MAG: DUF3237 family protein [Dehalococcoidia bacterium]|nr:DUF3237 family protein [Dehalococcoidia bacterium]
MMTGELRTEWLYDLSATTAPWHDIGDFGGGKRRIVPVTGGRVEGPHLSGDVLPFGADFFVERTDDVRVLDVRAIVRTGDGAEIYTFYPGLYHGQSLGPFGDLPEGERYFRTTPRFETGSEKYAWLNRILAVGVGWVELPDTVRYKVYAVL